jgi:hypothetical protein
VRTPEGARGGAPASLTPTRFSLFAAAICKGSAADLCAPMVSAVGFEGEASRPSPPSFPLPVRAGFCGAGGELEKRRQARRLSPKYVSCWNFLCRLQALLVTRPPPRAAPPPPLHRRRRRVAPPPFPFDSHRRRTPLDSYRCEPLLRRRRG